MRGCMIGAVVNVSLSFVNDTSHSLEKWNCMSLARSGNKSLAILLKFLINLRQKQACPRKEHVFHTSREGKVCNQIKFGVVYLYPLIRDDMTQNNSLFNHKMIFFQIKGHMLVLIPSLYIFQTNQAIGKRVSINGEIIHENFKRLLN